jgi:hypothetical protein
MKKLLLLLMLSFFSAQGYAGSCPDGSEPVKSVSVDGSYFIYECDEIINDDDLIQYNFNEAIGGPFCNEPNGFCASWKSNASKECKDNYRFGGNYSSTQERLNYETCIEQISLKPFIGTKYGTYFEINCSKSSNNTSMNNKNPTLDYNIKLLDNCKRDVEGNWTNDITRAKYMYVVGENGNCDYGLGNTEKGALNDCLRIKEKHNLVGSCVLYGKDGKVVMKGYSDLSWDMGDEGGSSSVDNNLTAKQNISGFEFINEAYTKMVEKNGVLEQSPLDTEITGWYARLPVDNDWHVGKIFYEKGQLKWKNLAGVEWSLQPDIDNNKLITGEDNPSEYELYFMLIKSSEKSKSVSQSEEYQTVNYNTKLDEVCQGHIQANWPGYIDINKNEFNSKGFMFVVSGEDGRCENGIGPTSLAAYDDCTHWKEENNIIGTCELYAKGEEVVWGSSESNQKSTLDTTESEDYVEKLKQIRSLLDTGIINKEDFEKMKQKIIDTMN